MAWLVAAALAAGGCMNPPAAATGTSDGVAAATSSEISPSESSPSKSGASCPASGVAVSAGPVDAAAGERAVTLTLVNCGSAPQTVEGYPGLSLLDEQRKVIDVRVIEQPDPVGSGTLSAPAPVTLAPGQEARAVLLWHNTVELGSEATPGSYLGVRPSPDGDEQLVALAVDLGTTGRLTVGPWRPAT